MAPGRKSCPSNYSLRQSRTCNRSAANERERKRMQSLSKAFTTLRAAIPWIPSDTKLSKLDTLTAAIEYISWLDEMLQLPNVHPPDIHSQEDPIQSIAQQKKTWLSSVKTNNKWRRLNCKIVDRAVKKHQRTSSGSSFNSVNSNGGGEGEEGGGPQPHHNSNSHSHSHHHHHHHHHQQQHLLFHHQLHPHPHQSSEREVKASIHESTCSSTHTNDNNNSSSLTCCTSSSICKSGDEEVALSDEGGGGEASVQLGPWNHQDTW